MSHKMLWVILGSIGFMTLLDAHIFVFPFIFMINTVKNKLPCCSEQGSKTKN
ncbi:hypothetical protein GCM10008935_22680 [Alkalibacillus silvisoli]|uniref:Uncharacterized protein n=1 Tax=Alkalibacillus silvisoli TaxID=392823 RepID=A0ABP3JX98_9BACI